jgi:hypothetical protein
MSKKAPRPARFAPLQHVIAEPVTDPAELAAIDEMLRKRRKRKQAMSKKTSRPARFAPLQHVIAEPITDPAELAAIDEMRKRRKRKQKGQQTTKSRQSAKAASNSAAKKECKKVSLKKRSNT